MADHTIEVERERAERGPHEHVFVAYVDGEPVMTSTKLEDRGAKGPEDGGYDWTTQLEVAAHAYLDGLEAADE